MQVLINEQLIYVPHPCLPWYKSLWTQRAFAFESFLRLNTFGRLIIHKHAHISVHVCGCNHAQSKHTRTHAICSPALLVCRFNHALLYYAKDMEQFYRQNRLYRRRPAAQNAERRPIASMETPCHKVQVKRACKHFSIVRDRCVCI